MYVYVYIIYICMYIYRCCIQIYHWHIGIGAKILSQKFLRTRFVKRPFTRLGKVSTLNSKTFCGRAPNHGGCPFIRWGHRLLCLTFSIHPSVGLSVASSIVHHFLGTIYHLIIIFGAHV